MNKNMGVAKRILKITLNTLFYLLILLLLLFSISNIRTKREDDIPNVFGRGFVNVLSESMDGSEKDFKVNSFKKDALVFVKLLKEEDKQNLKVGDIVVFWGQLDPTNPKSKGFIIHRIIAIDFEKKLVQTQGDNRVTNPRWEETSFSGIKAIATSKVETIGGAMRFAQTSTGFALLILLPLALLIVYEIFVLVRFIIKNNKEKLEIEYELEKEKMKQELLKELKEEQKEE